MTSRKEKRKAARVEKKLHKHQALLNHQKIRKSKQNNSEKANNVSSMKDRLIDFDLDEGPRRGAVEKAPVIESLRIENVIESDGDGDGDSGRDEVKPARRERKVKRGKTKFEEYLGMELNGGLSAEDDLEMERRLAKKLKLKKGRLDDSGDGLDLFFEGISSFDDFGEENGAGGLESDVSLPRKKVKKGKKKGKSDKDFVVDEVCNRDEGSCKEGEVDGKMDSEAECVESDDKKKSKRRKKKRRKSEQEKSSDDDASDMGQARNESGEEGDTPTEFVKETNPANGSQSGGKYVAPHLRSRAGGDELQEYLHIRRRIRGLLNRLSESNVESITGEISSIFQSVSRAVASQIICEEVLASCAGGPRGNEQYAAVFAAFVAGMASMVGIDFGARLMALLANSFENEYSKEDNLSLRNLSLLLSYLCIFGVCSSDLIYDFLIKLSKQLTEIDVSTILTVLQCCGMKLRADDPSAMKDFIFSVQSRVNELKASARDIEATTNSKRMEFMLETICDIKNNKKRAKDDSSPHTRIKKWLHKLRVEDITIRGVKWSKLLDPEKKGQWWFSGDTTLKAENVRKITGKIDKEGNEAQKMLKLAAEQRMNTESRRAIFCVIMSGEDYIDAFEQLLSLNLQGKQDREILRVLVECCLQEKVFNKYYTALASKLCSHDKNHKFTLQYCLWDQFKELESMSLMRSMNLAKFVAEMVAGFSLSLAVLKVVDLMDAAQLTTKRIMHFRMLFEAIFEYPDNVVWNAFTRVAITPELEDLRNGLEFFIREYVVPTNKKITKRFKLAKKALNNGEGVLM